MFFDGLCVLCLDCSSISDCDACIVAGLNVHIRSPCGWCLSSMTCINGNISGPLHPYDQHASNTSCVNAERNFFYLSCEIPDHCGGEECTEAQTCSYHTEPDGSATTFKCVTSTRSEHNIHNEPLTHEGQN